MGNNAATTKRINELEGKLANANKSIKELMEKHEPHALELGKLQIKHEDLETSITRVKKGLEKLMKIQTQAETKSYLELTELSNKVEDLANTVDSLHPDSEKWENFEQGWEKTIRDLKDWVEKTAKESAEKHTNKKMAAPPQLMSPMSMSQSGSSDSSQGSGSETNDSTPTRTPKKGAAGPFFDRKSDKKTMSTAQKPPLMKKRSFLSFLGVNTQPVHAHPE